MFKKTSSFFFQKYGDTYTTLPNDTNEYLIEDLEIDNKAIEFVFKSNEELYIHVIDGIVSILVSSENQSNTFEQFIAHHTIKLKKNVYFNFISITNSSLIRFTKKNHESISTVRLQGNKINCNRIIQQVRVDEILAYYYQVKSANYYFSGEKHNHWELTFMDSGQLETIVDGKQFILNEYDLMIYTPGQHHTQKASANTPCSYLTIMFDMHNVEPLLLQNQIFHATRDLSNVIQEFISMSERHNGYSRDLCVCYLNEIILKLLNYQYQKQVPIAHTPMQQKFENESLNEIIIYINDNIYSPLTIEQLCHRFSISRSSLQQLFKKNLNIAPKQYINDLKLKKATILIKESKYTISEISDKLGFTSIHYFSRKFKQHFNLAPSDYAKTIYK